MALNSNFRTLTADNIEGIVEDRNYLKSSFENGTITGWTEVAVALTSGLPTGTPTIGSSAASSLTLSATSVTPLSGSRSLLVDVPSALTAGHGFISDEFTLDRMDLGKVLTVSFDYERVSGTYNFSGTLGSQTWMVYIYDATAGGATWIQPAGFLGMNQSSGPGRVRATFQSSVTAGQKYRVAVIASQAAAGASSLEFDNFSCSRQTAPIGPVVTDFQEYLPTTSGFNAGTTPTILVRWRRIGDSIHIIGNYTAAGTGIGASGTFTFSLPSGLSFDTSKIRTFETAIGAGHILDNTVARFPCSVQASGSTNFVLTVRANAATGGNNVDQNMPSAGWWNAAGDCISFELMAPIAGWSSNVQLSNDTDTRVVAAAYLRSTAQTIPAATDTTVIYDTRRIDTHGAMNTSTGRFTAPVSGVYRISGSVFYNFFVPAAGNPLQMRFVKRSVAGVALEDTYKDNFTANAAVGQEIALRTTALFYCNAGETLEVILWQNTGASRTTIANINYVEIERLSGPSVVAANQVIAFSAYDGGSVAVTNTTSLLPMGTTDIDTHAVRSGQTYVIPVSGFYRISAKSTSKFSAGNIANNHALLIYKNGSPQNGGDYGNADAANGSGLEFFFLSVNSIFRLNAGDIIDFRYYTNYLGVATTYLKYCAVERLGGTG